MASIVTTRGSPEDVLHVRYERSAAALLAVARILERDRPLKGGEAEFLELVSYVRDVEPELFTRIWREPFAYWWSGVAYQLVAMTFRQAEAPRVLAGYYAAIGEHDLLTALKYHLDDFKRIVIGLALVEGKDLSLSEPLVRHSPIAIPGTRLVTRGSGEVTIAGVEAGQVVGPDAMVIPTEECPVAEAGGIEWRLQPAAFRLPGLGFEMPDESLDLASQQEIEPVVSEAFAIIARMRPELQTAFDGIARVVGFKLYEYADYTNLTHSELPGSFVCSNVYNAYDLADTLVHEFHHNLLFAIEEDSPFLEPGTERVIAYFSPWRNDVRDLHGILHAMYVYIGSTWYWLAVYNSGEAQGELRDYALDRLVRYPLQLRVGEAVLEDNARWTQHGRELFSRLTEARRELAAAVAEAGVPHDTPAVNCDIDGAFVRIKDEHSHDLTARQVVRSFLEKWDITGTGKAAIASHQIDL
jgi:HEXXH motif-containing protein